MVAAVAARDRGTEGTVEVSAPTWRRPSRTRKLPAHRVDVSCIVAPQDRKTPVGLLVPIVRAEQRFTHADQLEISGGRRSCLRSPEQHSDEQPNGTEPKNPASPIHENLRSTERGDPYKRAVVPDRFGRSGQVHNRERIMETRRRQLNGHGGGGARWRARQRPGGGDRRIRARPAGPGGDHRQSVRAGSGAADHAPSRRREARRDVARTAPPSRPCGATGSGSPRSSG